MKEDTKNVKKNSDCIETLPTTKKRPGGIKKMRLKTPEDYEEAISIALRLILQDPDPLMHSGRLASLVNAWSGLYKLDLEETEIKQLQKEVDDLKKKIK